jgi:hypothetical protein
MDDPDHRRMIQALGQTGSEHYPSAQSADKNRDSRRDHSNPDSQVDISLELERLLSQHDTQERIEFERTGHQHHRAKGRAVDDDNKMKDRVWGMPDFYDSIERQTAEGIKVVSLPEVSIYYLEETRSLVASSFLSLNLAHGPLTSIVLLGRHHYSRSISTRRRG